MQPLRSDIYNTLQDGTTYSLESLAHRYRTNEHVIRVQLDRLQQEGKKLKVTEDEVSVFIDHTRPIWIILPYIFMGFILTLALGGYING